MIYYILYRDTEDEILKAIRLLDDHETGGSTTGFEEFFKMQQALAPLAMKSSTRL